MGTLHQITPRLTAPARDAGPLLYTQRDMDAARAEAALQVQESILDALRGGLGTLPGPLRALAAKR